MSSVTELPLTFYAVFTFVFGLLVGSFLNVVIHRVPRGESIVSPGSHCGSCGAPVRPYDNIPLLSYVLLGGRCRKCKTKISLIYPTVELLTAVLFLAVLFKSGPTQIAVAETAFVAVIISLIFIDAQHQLLPDVITYPAFLLALVMAGLIGWQASHQLFRHSGLLISPPAWLLHPLLGALLIAIAAPLFWIIDRMDDVLFSKYFAWDEEPTETAAEETDSEPQAQRHHDRAIRVTAWLGIALAIGWVVFSYLKREPAFINAQTYLINAWFGALVGSGLIWLLRAAYFYTRGMEGMGLGDVKMIAVVGAFLGWQSAILVIILGSLLGSIVGLVLARRSSQGLKTALPFGVFLGIASLVALFAGAPLIQWYIRLMQP
jgi:leader peptidase (prepilin peptidase)/N-methyltransferase